MLSLFRLPHRSIQLLLLLALLAACTPGTLARPTPAIVYAPTVSPPTAAPLEATPDPRTPTMLPPNLGQATIAARATASPFPTANAVAITPGQPARASVQRDGLSFSLDLPKDDYLAGEGARAEITLRNNGAETVWINGAESQAAQVILLDEQGREPPPYPRYSAPHPAEPYLAPLAPGQVITSTITFHARPSLPASQHQYVLWAWTHFSRTAPENGNGPDNLWLHVESGPIPLHISLPDPSRQLSLQLDADRSGWRVKVTDGNGKVPDALLWGAMETATYESFSAGPLRDNSEGEWSGDWPDNRQGNEILVRAWVSAPGYVTAIASVMVPGNRSGRTMFDARPRPRRVFPSLDTAQVAVNLPLAKPGHLSPGTALDRVEVEDRTYDSHRRTFVWQIYRLPENQWLELTQMNWTGEFESAGWGRTRYDPEAQQARVSGATAYLVKQFNWWILDWKVDRVGFELHAPMHATSHEQLLSIAESVQP